MNPFRRFDMLNSTMMERSEDSAYETQPSMDVENSGESDFQSIFSAIPTHDSSILLLRDAIQSSREKSLFTGVSFFIEYRDCRYNRWYCIAYTLLKLGAIVDTTLTKATSFVIFKQGRMSTYKKAKQHNIPMTGVRWIEACRSALQLVSTDPYPINDIENYEQPELNGPLKRYRYFKEDIPEEFMNSLTGSGSRKQRIATLTSPADGKNLETCNISAISPSNHEMSSCNALWNQVVAAKGSGSSKTPERLIRRSTRRSTRRLFDRATNVREAESSDSVPRANA